MLEHPSSLSFSRFFLLLILAVAAILGFYNLNGYALTNDEIITTNIATGFGHSKNTAWNAQPIPLEKTHITPEDHWERSHVRNVLQFTSNDNGNMLAYNLLLHYFITIFGVSDLGLRGLSVLFYLVSIFIFYRIMRITTRDQKLIYLATLLFTLNPVVLHYGRQIRSYEFGLMVTLLMTWLLLKVIYSSSRKLKPLVTFTLVYSILFALSFLSHYYTIYIFGGHILFIMIRKEKELFISLGIAFLLTVSAFMIWYFNGGQEGMESMNALDNFIREHTSHQTQTSLRSITEGLVAFINSVNGYYFQYLGYRNQEFFYLIIILAFCFIASIISLRYTSTDPSRTREKTMYYLFSAMIFSCLAVLIASAIRSEHTTSFHTRYGVFVIPYFSAFLATGLIYLFRGGRVLKTTAVLLLLIHTGLMVMNYKIPLSGHWFTYADVGGKVREARNTKAPENPYSAAARRIIESNADTVAMRSHGFAQYTNMYLKNVRVVEYIDTTLTKEYELR